MAINILYFTICFALIAAAIYSYRKVVSKSFLHSFIAALLLSAISFIAFEFHFEQKFVKSYGGSMSIENTEGFQHLGSTWKGDHLWIERYDPSTNTCIFSEYSKGSILEGKVVIKNCNAVKLQ